MNIKNIVLLSKYNNQELTPFVQKVANHLESLDCNVSVDQETLKNTKINLPESDYKSKKDLAIVIGGDGTMLSAARTWGVNGTPLVGINQGRVGFLTDIPKDEVFEKITDIIHGKFKTETREVLNVKLFNKHELIDESLSINDFLVSCATSRKLIEISLFIDDEFVYNQYSDGLIIATATGSTAHALSAGGSLIHPSSSVFNLVPISPQSLSNRPLVISSDKKIKVLISSNEDISYSSDGINPKNMPKNSYFLIERNTESFTLYHPEDYSYYEGLRSKLNWL